MVNPDGFDPDTTGVAVPDVLSRRALGVLRQHGSLSLELVSEALGVPEVEAAAALIRLWAKGRARITGTGSKARWRLPLATTIGKK